LISYSNQKKFTICLKLVIINRSSLNINLFEFDRVIKSQLYTVFNLPKQNLVLKIETKVLYKYKLSQLYNKLVLCICDSVQHNNPAETHFKGLLICINKLFIQEILSGKNTRTIPHEFGHALGLDHPHARASFNTINEEATTLEKQIPINEFSTNLMSQTWYVQKANININKAINLHQNQIELIKQNLMQQKLNNNYSIKKMLFWYKWVV